MGTTLTGTTPQDTYDSLIKVTDNGPISGTLKLLSDGLGNDSALALSTSVTAIRSGQQLRLFRADNAIYGSIQYLTGAGGFKFDDANGDGYTFAQGTDTRLFINTTGNVGIGTSAPTTLGAGITSLDVAGSAGGGLTTRGTTVTGELIALDAAAGFFISTKTNHPIVLRTNDLERVRVTNNGLTFNGDTAAANALDDYEEGTWTMGVSFGGASVGVTTTIKTGTYTKIGRQVTVNGLIVLTSKGSSAGAARITGLPFSIPFNNAFFSAAALKFSKINFANQFQGFGIINTTTILLTEITEAGVETTINEAEFANDSEIIVSFTYFV